MLKFKQKRAITREEHEKILAGENNPEWHAYYELLWYLGGSQTDMARLSAKDIDWANRTVSYARVKTNSRAVIHFDEAVEKILRSLSTSGELFPQIAPWPHSDRAKTFIRRLKLVGVSGVSLHSYRYARAERAKQCGYPERFAQEALGHNSKSVHRAYSRNATMILPSLESFEKARADQKIVPFPQTPARNDLPMATNGGCGIRSKKGVGVAAVLA